MAGSLAAVDSGGLTGLRRRRDENVPELAERGGAWTELELGFIELRQGNPGAAEIRFNQARQIYERIGDRSGLARAHLELGILATTLDDPEDAGHLFRKALAFYDEINAPQSNEIRERLANL